MRNTVESATVRVDLKCKTTRFGTVRKNGYVRAKYKPLCCRQLRFRSRCAHGRNKRYGTVERTMNAVGRPVMTKILLISRCDRRFEYPRQCDGSRSACTIPANFICRSTTRKEKTCRDRAGERRITNELKSDIPYLFCVRKQTASESWRK